MKNKIVIKSSNNETKQYYGCSKLQFHCPKETKLQPKQIYEEEEGLMIEDLVW